MLLIPRVTLKFASLICSEYQINILARSVRLVEHEFIVGLSGPEAHIRA